MGEVGYFGVICVAGMISFAQKVRTRLMQVLEDSGFGEIGGGGY